MSPSCGQPAGPGRLRVHFTSLITPNDGYPWLPSLYRQYWRANSPPDLPEPVSGRLRQAVPSMTCSKCRRTSQFQPNRIQIDSVWRAVEGGRYCGCYRRTVYEASSSAPGRFRLRALSGGVNDDLGPFTMTPSARRYSSSPLKELVTRSDCATPDACAYELAHRFAGTVLRRITGETRHTSALVLAGGLSA